VWLIYRVFILSFNTSGVELAISAIKSAKAQKNQLKKKKNFTRIAILIS